MIVHFAPNEAKSFHTILFGTFFFGTICPALRESIAALKGLPYQLQLDFEKN